MLSNIKEALQVTGIAARAQEGHYPIDQRLQAKGWGRITHRTGILHDYKATRFFFDMSNNTFVRRSLTPSEVANLLARCLRSFSNDMPMLVYPPSCRCICRLPTRLSLKPKRSLNRSSTACATHARQEPGMETSSLVASRMPWDLVGHSSSWVVGDSQ